jgi:hypothetical protein
MAVFLAVFAGLGFGRCVLNSRYLDAMAARPGTKLGLDHEAELLLRNPLRALLGVPVGPLCGRD